MKLLVCSSSSWLLPVIKSLSSEKLWLMTVLPDIDMDDEIKQGFSHDGFQVHF